MILLVERVDLSIFCHRRASVYPPDLAAKRIIQELYRDEPIFPILPKDRKKVEMAERDAKIRERYSNGDIFKLSSVS